MAISRWRRFRRYVTYLLIRTVLVCWRVLPLPVARGAGALLGALVHALAGTERRRARLHMAHALPELDPRERRRLVRRCFRHLGVCAAEVALVDRIRRRFDRMVELPGEDRRILEATLAEGQGALIVSGHIGNWELLGFYLAWSGYPVRTLARALKDPRLDRFVRRYRESRGVRTILRGEPRAARAMLQAFRDGAMLGFFLDQDTDVAGVFAPFFGRPAWTPQGAAVLALRMQAPVLVVTMSRIGAGRHRVRIQRYDPRPSPDRDVDVVRITADLNALLEERIRAAPAQWVWMHQRWRRQPAHLQPLGSSRESRL